MTLAGTSRHGDAASVLARGLAAWRPGGLAAGRAGARIDNLPGRAGAAAAALFDDARWRGAEVAGPPGSAVQARLAYVQYAGWPAMVRGKGLSALSRDRDVLIGWG